MPQRIDLPLLRRRAEHNDGIVSTLRELALHQLGIARIEGLGTYCRGLRILLMQDNLVGRIEGLEKLRDLEYLNLAVNNVRRVEGLGRCEALAKLDLTLNFVRDLGSVESLRANELLGELYLVGNPCCSLQGYREFVVAALPQLKVLDGQEITDEERREALARQEEVRARIFEQLRALPAEDDAAPAPPEADLERRRERFCGGTALPHTPAARLEVARELEELRAAGAPKPPPIGPGGVASLEPPREEVRMRLRKEDGTPYLRNDGRWKFEVRERGRTVVLDVELGREVHPDQVDVEAWGRWARVAVLPPGVAAPEGDGEDGCGAKGGKYLQLELPCEIDGFAAERSAASGRVRLTMRRAAGAAKREVDKEELPTVGSAETLKELAAREETEERDAKSKEEAARKEKERAEEAARREAAASKRRHPMHKLRMELRDGDEEGGSACGGETLPRRRPIADPGSGWESTAPVAMLSLN